MIKKIIRSKINAGLKTRVGIWSLEQGEVVEISFSSEEEYKRVLDIGSIEPAREIDLVNWQSRGIPIIEPEIETEPESTLVQEPISKSKTGEPWGPIVEPESTPESQIETEPEPISKKPTVKSRRGRKKVSVDK